MRETWAPSLGWEDPLEEEMATHSIILAWRIPWTEEPGAWQATVHGRRVGHDWATDTHISSVHMSVPVSQFFPSLLPHLDAHLFVFYICVSMFRFADKIIHVWLSLIRNKKWIQMLDLFLWARWAILRDIRELLGNDPGEMETLWETTGVEIQSQTPLRAAGTASPGLSRGPGAGGFAGLVAGRWSMAVWLKASVLLGKNEGSSSNKNKLRKGGRKFEERGKRMKR